MTPIPFLGLSDPFSSFTHLMAAVAALVGSYFLLKRGRGNTGRVVSLVIFSFSLVFLFSMSGVFHLLDRDGDAREVLQRLDHAGIWTLIAGTFTPIHVILLRGHWRWGVLAVVWVSAITALVLEVIFFHSFSESLLVSLFLGLGWIGGITGTVIMRTFRDRSIRYLVAGALFYSAGAVIDFLRWPVLWPGVIGSHEIFHVFVMMGAASHWVFVFIWAHHPVQNQIAFDVIIISNHSVIARSIGESIEVSGATIEEVKEKILNAVAEKYHRAIQPKIRLRYRHEENI